MNTLPEHRRAIYGRTYGRTWQPADFDPITPPFRVRDRRVDRWLIGFGVVTLVVLVCIRMGVL